MLKCDMTRGRKLIAAILVATALIGSALPGSKFVSAAGAACALVPNERDPSERRSPPLTLANCSSGSWRRCTLAPQAES